MLQQPKRFEVSVTYILRVLGDAAGSGSIESLLGMVLRGEEPPLCYVETFDHEAHDGRGFGTFTSDPEKALRFPSFVDAHEFWCKVPKCRPLRDDCKPNRPLTAYSISFIQLGRND